MEKRRTSPCHVEVRDGGAVVAQIASIAGHTYVTPVGKNRAERRKNVKKYLPRLARQAKGAAR